jgi:hypothetical protein
MSTTRGVSFLPGNMTPEQQAEARKQIADARWQRTEDNDDRWRRKQRRDR